MLTGSCHCGAVRLSVSRKPRKLTQCTCSTCRRYGAMWAYGSPRTISVEARRGAIGRYIWGDRVIEFCFCRTCGCLTHYDSLDKTPDRRIAVNARMLEPGDLAGIRVRTFDGADTWKYLD